MKRKLIYSSPSCIRTSISLNEGVCVAASMTGKPVIEEGTNDRVGIESQTQGFEEIDITTWDE